MTPAIALDIAGGCAALAYAFAMQVRARTDRFRLRIALAREEAFVDAARRLAESSGISLEAVRTEIERTLRELAPALDAFAFFEERDGALVCAAASGERLAYFTHSVRALDDGDAPAIRALACGHRVIASAADGRPRLHPSDTFNVAIPLALEAGRRCVLVACARRSVEPETLERIVGFVELAAPAYRIARERASDRQRAEYDGLTGLLTPRAFRRELAAGLDRARCEPLGRVALLFVDSDHFKAWNDRYGHASGDVLLREIAHVLRGVACGPGDLAARNGGDEFCVVLGDTEKSAAVVRALALRRRIAEIDFAALRPAGAPNDVSISASIGVAAFPVDAATASDLLERADEAMYHSKHTGRDAVSYFGVDGRLERADEAAVFR